MLYCIVLLFREKRTQEKSRITFLSVYCNPFFFFFSDIFLDISRGLKIAVGKVCDISAKYKPQNIIHVEINPLKVYLKNFVATIYL